MDIIRIAAIGDSVIYGRNDPYGGWIGRIRRSIETTASAAGVFNLGVGGQNSEHIAQRISEISARTPNTVIVGCGLNDMRNVSQQGDGEIPIHLFQENITKIIRFCAASSINRTLIATMHPIDFAEEPFDGLWYSYARWREYNQALRSIAIEHDAEVIEFDDLPDFTLASGMLGDKIHPSPTGHELMAQRALTYFF